MSVVIVLNQCSTVPNEPDLTIRFGILRYKVFHSDQNSMTLLLVDTKVVLESEVDARTVMCRI